MPAIKTGGALMLALATTAFVASLAHAADVPLSEAQLVEIAVEANPAVKSARYRWDTAVHSISQTVAPNDPIFTYTNSDSVKQSTRARGVAGIQFHRDVPISRQGAPSARPGGAFRRHRTSHARGDCARRASRDRDGIFSIAARPGAGRRQRRERVEPRPGGPRHRDGLLGFVGAADRRYQCRVQPRRRSPASTSVPDSRRERRDRSESATLSPARLAVGRSIEP